MNLNHESVLDKDFALVLNKFWIVISSLTVRKAVVALMGGDEEPPVLALDMQRDVNGNLLYANPLEWSDWVNLPVREGDFYIQTNHSQIRCPTVVITRNFSKVPRKRPRLSLRSIFERDKGRCQYSNKLLSHSSATLDHVHPRSRGGKETFLNLVLCDKQINIMKANRTPEEAGLRLLRKPVVPPDMPISATITRANHRDWEPFLFR